MQKPLYKIVQSLLIDNPNLRDSDKKLQWKVCELTGHVINGTMTMEAFLSAPSMESIRRVRQKIQERMPSLRSSPGVQLAKKRKQATKGAFIFREKIEYEFRDGVAIPI